MSGTITPDGRGSHGGGGGDSQKTNQIQVATPVTNQQILPLPPGLGDVVSCDSLRMINLIQIDFSIEVSRALTRAYERVRDVVVDGMERLPSQSTEDGNTIS